MLLVPVIKGLKVITTITLLWLSKIFKLSLKYSSLILFYTCPHKNRGEGNLRIFNGSCDVSF